MLKPISKAYAKLTSSIQFNNPNLNKYFKRKAFDDFLNHINSKEDGNVYINKAMEEKDVMDRMSVIYNYYDH